MGRLSWTLSLGVSSKSMDLLILIFWQLLWWVNGKENNPNKFKTIYKFPKILNAKETKINVTIIIWIKSIWYLLFGSHGFDLSLSNTYNHSCLIKHIHDKFHCKNSVFNLNLNYVIINWKINILFVYWSKILKCHWCVGEFWFNESSFSYSL